jgi:hypothetical protein
MNLIVVSRLLTLVACLAGLVELSSSSAGAASPVVTRGPYLQLGTPTSVIVRFRTDVAGVGRVSYGTNAASLNLFSGGTASTTNHSVQLSNLAPDTAYFYSVGLTNLTLASGTNYFFRTGPPPGSRQPFRVWALGDFGFTNASAGPVRDAYYNFAANRYTDLWLMLGDNCYHGGPDSVWQVAVFNTYSNILRQTPVWSTIGNQETFNQPTVSNTAPYFENFTFPTNAEAGGVASGTERYYSFDYGNVHFVCLDSMSSARTAGSPMLLWLEADLQQNTNEWLIAFFHHPPYSKGSNDSDTKTEQIQMRGNAVPLLESYGVDLVLSGHSHSYERSYLIDGHYGLSSTFSTNTMLKDGGNGRVDGTGAYGKATLGAGAHEGAVYVVAGSGAALGGGTLNHRVMFSSSNVLGSLVLDFHANRLEAKFLRETGAIDDYFTLIKGAEPLRILSASVVSNTLSLSWNSVADRTYRVEFSPTLPAASWTNVSGSIKATGITATWSESPGGLGAGGFYRIWSLND